jgi:hypothetical protein
MLVPRGNLRRAHEAQIARQAVRWPFQLVRRGVQRAVRYRAVQQSALLAIVDEEGQLSEWRQRRRAVPFGMPPPA